MENLKNYFGEKLNIDSTVLAQSADDYGHTIKRIPKGVFTPKNANDIVELINQAKANNLTVIAKGQSHNTYGHSQAKNAIVIDMNALNQTHTIEANQVWVDAGICWDDLLVKTMDKDLTPPTITDYPHVTVGGTISVGGVGAQTFNYGTQADNVLALEVVTGNGKLIKCSPTSNADLFYSCLGGLGQIGIITKVLLKLKTAPQNVRFYRTFHADLNLFLNDLKRLINERKFDTIQGFAVPNSTEVIAQIYGPEAAQFEPQPNAGKWLYMIELGKYYENNNELTEKDDSDLTRHLSIIKNGLTILNLTYLQYVRRLDILVATLKELGIWEMPHPWVNLLIGAKNAETFISKSLAELAFEDVGQGAILIYPYNTKEIKVPLFRIPEDEQIFKFALLRNALPPQPEQVQKLITDNKKLYNNCLTHKGTRYPIDSVPMDQSDWKIHFGNKWEEYKLAKNKYDSNNTIANNQGIW